VTREDESPSRIAAGTARVVVVGQGYVGLTLAAAAAEAGFAVTGYDVDAARVERLAAGELAVAGVDEGSFRSAVASSRLAFAAEPAAVAGADAVFICVPTPLRDGEPDLSYVEDAARTVGETLRRGSLLVLESTTYPGTTDVVVRGLVRDAGGLEPEDDYLLAYSPERIDPGNRSFGMRNTPRVVGGVGERSLEVAASFYRRLVDEIVTVSSTRTAEAVKLLENTFRHVNIALVNEYATLSGDLGIDVWEVVEAAATKPFGFMRFEPGPGIGGHCIPIDPAYLAWHVRRDTGRRFGILEEAQAVNDAMPAHIADRIDAIVEAAGAAMPGARLLVLGVAYKPDVADARGSPAVRLIQLLSDRGASVEFHDPLIDAVEIAQGRLERVEALEAALGHADVVVLLTPHSTYDLPSIAARARAVFDARNAFGRSRPDNVFPL
jgi:UDP-N-acetyl-D-glucosamine dehydrogenase